MTTDIAFSSGDSTIDGMLNELYDCRDSDTHWCEVIDRFMPVLARLVEHVKNYDAMIERSVGAMAIAEGGAGYEKIVIDCPMLFAVSELRFKYNALVTEKTNRDCAQTNLGISP